MKITDYEKVQELAASNIFLLDGPNGTKTIGTTAVTLHLAAIILLSCRMKHFTMHR